MCKFWLRDCYLHRCGRSYKIFRLLPNQLRPRATLWNIQFLCCQIAFPLALFASAMVVCCANMKLVPNLQIFSTWKQKLLRILNSDCESVVRIGDSDMTAPRLPSPFGVYFSFLISMRCQNVRHLLNTALGYVQDRQTPSGPGFVTPCPMFEGTGCY